MSIHVNVNNSWQTVIPYVNVNGTWKECDEVYTKVAGVWKPLLYEPGTITVRPPFTYLFTVPKGVFSVKFSVYGGGGGGGKTNGGHSATAGGMGDIITNNAFAVRPGQQYLIMPGAGGMGGHSRIASSPNTGIVAGGQGGTPSSSGGAGGNGGDATIIFNGPKETSPPLCVAAGGGGGGGGGTDWGSQLGARTTTLVQTIGTNKLTKGGAGQAWDDEGGCGGGGGGFGGGAGGLYSDVKGFNSKNGGTGGHGGQSFFATGQGWSLSPYDAAASKYTPADTDGYDGYVKITW